MIGIGHNGGVLYLFKAAVRSAVGNITFNGIGKQKYILHGHADVVPQMIQIQPPHILAVHQDLAGGGVVEPA